MSYLSIDVGGTNLKYALIDRAGKISKREHKRTPKDLEGFKEVLSEIITEYKDDIRAVVLSCPGKIDSVTGTIYLGGALTYLHEFEIGKFIHEQFELPCSIVNDGKAAALAELWLGTLHGVENGASVTLGTGVGGGLILNGGLHQGSHFQAGELSFMLFGGFQEITPEIVGGYTGSAVRFIYEAATALGLEDVHDGKTVFAEIEKGNPLVVPLFEQYCRNVALIIFNMRTLLDLEKVAIGGGISAQKIVIDEIKHQYGMIEKTMQERNIYLDPLEIVACEFMNDAGLLGALYYYFLEIEGQ